MWRESTTDDYEMYDNSKGTICRISDIYLIDTEEKRTIEFTGDLIGTDKEDILSMIGTSVALKQGVSIEHIDKFYDKDAKVYIVPVIFSKILMTSAYDRLYLNIKLYFAYNINGNLPAETNISPYRFEEPYGLSAEMSYIWKLWENVLCSRKIIMLNYVD